MMATYTIELGKLLSLEGFNIGLQDYPLPNYLNSAGERENFRNALNQKIINHYQFNEICCLPPDRFKVFLNNTMNEKMPYFNLLYDAMAEKWKFYTGGTLNEVVTGNASDNSTYNRESTDTLSRSGEDTTSSVSNQTNTSNDYNLAVTSDTPGQMLNIESDIAANTYASNATKQKSNSNSSNIGNTNDTTKYGSTDTTTRAGKDTDTKQHNDNMNRTVSGLNGKSYAELFREYSESIRNLDLEVINSVKDCFMGIL